MESLLLHRYSLALSALHCLQQLQSGACSTSTTQPLSLTQESNGTTPSGPAPDPQPSPSYIISHFPLVLTRDVRTQTVSLCSVPSIHHATTADASTQLSISEFLQLCVTKHFMKTFVKHRPPATLETRWQSRSPMSSRSTLLPSSSSVASSPGPSRRVPSPAPLCFKMHLLRLLHTVPLSQMLPPSSRSQSSLLGASTPMTRWIVRLLSLRTETSVASHFTIPSTTAATRSRVSNSPVLSPWHPCQSSARDTLVATCSCLHLVRCVIQIHFYAVLAATGSYPTGNTFSSFFTCSQKECQYRPGGNPLCHRCRPRAGRGPFPKLRPVVLPMIRFGLPKTAEHGYLHNADSDLMHHQCRLSTLQWNPGPARRNPTNIIAATCGRFHAVIPQEASDHFTHLVLITLFPLPSFRSTTSNTFTIFDVFLLFSFGLIDQSYRNASFLGVVSHHLLAFLVKAVFHHPVDVFGCSAVQFPSWL